MNRYRCEGCGCRLDPGEGSLCEECRADLEKQAAALPVREVNQERGRRDVSGKASA